MDNTYLSVSSEDKIKIKVILLIVGVIAAFALLSGYLLYAGSEDLPTDPPPIIIKSGSFIMESENVFQPDAANQRSYKNPQFNAIKGIRVISYSENAQNQTIDKKFFEGKDSSWQKGDVVQVNVYIQTCLPNASGLCTTWSGLKKVEVYNAGSDLSVNVPDELHLSKARKNKKNKRQHKNEDENVETIRFYMVEIINKTQNIQIAALFAQEGQEYYIGFYNTLATVTAN